MLLVRWLILLPLLVAIGAFIAYAVTGQQRYRVFGLRVFRITLAAAVFMFAVMIYDRLA
jgi:putative effector of murein hydrolase